MSNRKFNTKRINKGIIAGALALSLVISSTGSIVVNKTKVEAKKKNTKPKLTLKGKLKKKKLTITEGETVKINATAKDKEDGNLNKKIKITVKKPTNGKYKKTGKTIKFINDGTYKVTVSVKDSKKAKASQTIKVVVKDKENTNANTNGPVPYTNEEPKVVETQKPTVKPTEVPVAPSADLSKYGKIEKVTVNGVTYKINVEPTDEFKQLINDTYGLKDFESIEYEKAYVSYIVYDSNKNNYKTNCSYMSFIGNIKAIDKYGIDVSNNLIITEEQVWPEEITINLGCVDSKGNYFSIQRFYVSWEYEWQLEQDLYDWEYVDENNGILFFGTTEPNYKVEGSITKKLAIKKGVI